MTTPTRHTGKQKNRPIVSMVISRVILPAALILMLIWFGARYLSLRSLETEISDNLSARTRAAAVSVKEKLDGFKEYARILSINELVINGLMDYSHRENYLPTFFYSLKVPGIQDAEIALLDYRGRFLVSNKTGRTDPPPRELVKTVMKGTPVFTVDDGKIGIARPVLYNGLAEGIFLIRISFTELPRLFSTTNPLTAFCVLKKPGRLIFSTDVNFHAGHLSSRGPAQGLNTKPGDNPDWLEKTIDIPAYESLSMVSGIRKQAAMQQHKKMETLLIIAMTLDLLALILGIFLSAHLTAKPLKTFVRVIDHARSANTFNIRLPETGPREIVSLASMFNTLFTEREQARKESLHQAIEAGRAQLSAMVLHNIGNAVTPLTVLPKRLTGKEMEDIRIFLEKCVEDLKEHRETLSDYVNTDSRGRRVFEYMEDLIRSLKDENARRKSLVQKIETSIAYISEVLSLQQSYAPRAGEIKEKVDLNDILNTAIRIQGPGLEKSRIRVDRNLSPDLAPILIDKSRLLQVMINLIKNSCEAIDQAGDMTAAREIRVTTFTRETGMGFTLEDTGVGIDPSAGKKIFEFGESRKGSSGMGLYYCRMFVESNHGTISLASSGLNQGAAVRVEFSKPTDQSK